MPVLSPCSFFVMSLAATLSPRPVNLISLPTVLLRLPLLIEPNAFSPVLPMTSVEPRPSVLAVLLAAVVSDSATSVPPSATVRVLLPSTLTFVAVTVPSPVTVMSLPFSLPKKPVTFPSFLPVDRLSISTLEPSATLR